MSINYKINTEGNGVYIFLIEGSILAGNENIFRRDGIGIWETKEIKIKANEDSQILLIEVPIN